MRLLAPSRYTDPAVAEAERERIFGRSWQFAGSLEDLAGPWQPYRTVATLYLWRTLSPQEDPSQTV